MDELRSEIWDYLSQRGKPVSVDDLARHFTRDPATIWAAVDHAWFELDGDVVGIAYTSSPAKAPRVSDKE